MSRSIFNLHRAAELMTGAAQAHTTNAAKAGAVAALLTAMDTDPPVTLPVEELQAVLLPLDLCIVHADTLRDAIQALQEALEVRPSSLLDRLVKSLHGPNHEDDCGSLGLKCDWGPPPTGMAGEKCRRCGIHIPF